jgi:cytochrome c
VAGFNYSPALKASKIIWTDANLDKWIANPTKLVPGSRMPYAGLADAAKRKELVAYLKTLK